MVRNEDREEVGNLGPREEHSEQTGQKTLRPNKPSMFKAMWGRELNQARPQGRKGGNRGCYVERNQVVST